MLEPFYLVEYEKMFGIDRLRERFCIARGFRSRTKRALGLQ